MFSILKSKDVKELKGEQTNRINEQALLDAINGVIHNKGNMLTAESVGSKAVADAWSKMCRSLCNNRGKCTNHLDKLNETLEDLTQMDFAKDLINHIGDQKNSLEVIAASSEEMAASIHEIASYAQNVAASSDEANRIAIDGSGNINQTVRFVEKAFTDIENVSSQMQEVHEKTDQINSIVSIVKEIADQTNLLALNAAIEAARAGEQGRGFAVVAEEVKKLAENTKHSVREIEANIQLLEEVIKNLGLRIQETAGQLSEGRTLVHSSLQSMDSMTDKFDEVNKAIMQISANAEEQNSATENFTNEIERISSFAEKLMQEADKTGKAIFKVSEMCNGLKLNILDDGVILDTKSMLDVCKTDHLMWRWRVYNMTLGYENIDVHTIGTHQECRLGKWYNSEGKKLFANHSLFQQMEGPHAQLHELAKKATIAYQQGDVRKAEELLAEMDQCSNQIVQTLDELKRML